MMNDEQLTARVREIIRSATHVERGGWSGDTDPEELKSAILTLIHEERAEASKEAGAAADAMEKAEYELAMGKSIIDQFLTDEGRRSLGYCGTGKCGLCPMCRMNNALNILKFSRPVA